jgi:hypothetical protein
MIDELDFLKVQLARLPTRKELAQITLLSTLTGTALVLVGTEAFFFDDARSRARGARQKRPRHPAA